MFGVAAPSDLIRDKHRTPFNIGKAIELHGFQLQEAMPLATGLEGKVSNPQAVLQEILDWTGGQPFLTQKLCTLVAQEKQNVTKIVQNRIIENWEEQDELEHLRTIRDRLLKDKNQAVCFLELYQQIMLQGTVDAKDNREEIELMLSGLVVKENGKITVSNRIYAVVFNDHWVEQQLSELHTSYRSRFKNINLA